MKCCLQLDDYLDGDLTPLEREAFLREAAKCPDCQAALESARWMDQSLRQAWEEVRIPTWNESAALPELSAAQVEEDSNPNVQVHANRTNTTWMSRTLVSWGAAITCLLLIGFIGWWMHLKLTHSNRPQVTKTEESTFKEAEKQENSHASAVQPQSTIVAETYDNEGIMIGGPYIGYKAVDQDDFTLVMVYRIPEEYLTRDSDSDSTQDSTNFD